MYGTVEQMILLEKAMEIIGKENYATWGSARESAIRTTLEMAEGKGLDWIRENRNMLVDQLGHMNSLFG